MLGAAHCGEFEAGCSDASLASQEIWDLGNSFSVSVSGLVLHFRCWPDDVKLVSCVCTGSCRFSLLSAEGGKDGNLTSQHLAAANTVISKW